MDATLRAIALCSLLLVGSGRAAETWTALFDGTSLRGWQRAGYVNGIAEYTVQDGCIVGTTLKGTPNSFLCTDRAYANFVLEFEFLVPSGMNSGVQIRSVCDPQVNNGRVHGYQVEIDPSARGWTAGIYDEGRRGWLYNLTHIMKDRGKEAADAARQAFRAGAWNQIRVEAVGTRLQTWLNGVHVADLTDGMTASGVIALQVHGTDDPVPRQIRWRNLRLQELPATPIPDEAWKALRGWRYAESRAGWQPIADAVAAAPGEAWNALEVKLIAVLDDNAATPDARTVVCGWLGRRGSPAAVAPLARRVGTGDVPTAAIQALGRLPHPGVGEALRAGLKRDLPVGDVAALVGAIGRRRDETALDELANLTGHASPVVRQAAIAAIGHVGTLAAEERLRAAAAAPELEPARAEALLNCAERARLDGDRARAERLCRELLGPRGPENVAAAALTVLADTIGEAALPDVLTALAGDSPARRAAAAQRLADLPGQKVGREAAAVLNELPPASQVMALSALAARADLATAPPAAALLASADDRVRVAAARLLQAVAGPAEVPALLDLAAGTGPAADTALQALSRSPTPGLEPALIAAIQGDVTVARRLAGLKALGARGCAQTVPLALTLLSTTDAEAQRACWRALRDLAGPEHAPGLLAAMVAMPDGTARREANRAVAECLRRAPDAAVAGSAVLAALTTSPPEARPALIALLGECPVSQVCAATVALLQDADAQCRYEAAKVLAEWPSAEPYDALRAYAAGTDQETHHVIALRGCLRLADLDDPGSEDQRQRRLDDLAAIARRPQEKEQIRAARLGLRVTEAKARSGRAYAVVRRGFVKDGKVYTDRPYVFTAVPELLTGAIQVATAMEDKYSKGADFLTFRISAPATVIIAYDGRAAKPPDWLQDWQALAPVLRSTDAGCPLKLFAKPFAAGVVSLPGNSPVAGVGAMYAVGVTPAPGP